MKKTLLSTVIATTLALLSVQANAENLQTIYQLATKKDPQVLKAAATRDAAKAAIDVSKASLLPQIGFSASANKSIGDQYNSETGTQYKAESTSTSAGIALRQSVFDWSNWENLEISEKVALQSQTAYNATVQALIVRVSQAYFDVLSADDDLSFVVAEKRAIERQLEQTKQRFAVGLTAITDVHEAQAQFDSAVASEIAAQNSLEIAREYLREITGEYHSQLDTLNTSRFAPSQPNPASPQDWVQLAQDNNLELKVRKLSVEIAEHNINVAESGHYPTVDFTAQTGFSDSKSKNRDTDITFNSPKADSSSVGLELSVPIYSGGATSANEAVKRANYVEASEDLELSYRSVVRQVRSNYNNVGSLISSTKALQQAVVSAESALKATEAGFEVGTRTIVDVLQSTRNLFNARRNLSKARYDYILSILALKQAAGTLTEEDLFTVNKALGN
ncbi:MULTISPECIES: outer membrane channel protein TolC [Rheinheimera]|uniref:Outer membrane channel protein TolC n=1 Tax=Rheinheimera marina TaxID=1774958 RepID=A0ABV9JPX4_9GAMM